MDQWDVPRSIISARLLTDVAAEHGVPAADCVRDTGIPVAALDDPEWEIAAWQELVVCRNVATALGNAPGLGLEIGLRYRVALYGSVGLGFLASPTLRAAAELSARYRALIFVLCRVRWQHAGAVSRFLVDAQAVPADLRRFVVERDVGAMVTMIRDILGEPAPLRAVELGFPAPSEVERYREVFGPRVGFGAPVTRVSLDDAVLDRPTPQANRLALWQAEATCRSLLARRRARGTAAGQVLDRIRAAHGTPSAEQVAAALLTTARTLRRRLAEEGTSYRALVEQARREVAVDLLRASELTVEQVAARLGYAEPSAFTHAFKRWTGVTPGAYRARPGPPQSPEPAD